MFNIKIYNKGIRENLKNKIKIELLYAIFQIRSLILTYKISLNFCFFTNLMIYFIRT